MTQLRVMLEADFPLSQKPSPLEQEIAQHTAFQESRAKFYVGRGNLQEAISSHIFLNEGRPLVVVGESGRGKVSLKEKRLSICLLVDNPWENRVLYYPTGLYDIEKRTHKD